LSARGISSNAEVSHEEFCFISEITPYGERLALRGKNLT
jgi:hypothetical protein